MEPVFDGNDVYKIFNSFLNIFLRIYYSSFPLIQANSKMNRNSWITTGIITSCKHKRELYKELQINNNDTLASYYRDYTKILSMVIRKAKIIEHDKLIKNSQNKAKTTWGIRNKESGRNKKRSEIQALNVEGKKITDQRPIAETFNDYFVAIAETVKKQRKNHFINNDNNSVDNHTHFIEQDFNKPYPSMGSKYTTTREIERIIKSFKTKNSYGYDKIPTKILKLSSPFISSPINYICNKMLLWGIFPVRLKYAIIQPLHKIGDRCDLSKYRPVSLLTSFSKIFETLTRKRILKYLTKRNILSTEQYGFRLGFRTDNATYKLTTEILNAMNNKLLVGGIFCDLEEAFDFGFC
jgi:hypothetical protein